MGAQPILPAIGLALASLGAGWSKHATHERVAVIDLGPADPEVRKHLEETVVAAGLDPVIGDGVEDALAGEATDRDAVLLDAAIAQARGALDAGSCKDAITAAETAIA